MEAELRERFGGDDVGALRRVRWSTSSSATAVRRSFAAQRSRVPRGAHERLARGPRARAVLAPLRGADPASRGRRTARSRPSRRYVARVGGGARVRGRAATRPATSPSTCPASAGHEQAPDRDPPGPPRHGLRARVRTARTTRATAELHVVRDGDWVRAEGRRSAPTTASRSPRCSRVAEDPRSPHGPLELLMTVAEEVGLQGAQALDPALVTGDVLLNLDSEEDGTLTIGCAGERRPRAAASTRRGSRSRTAPAAPGHRVRRPRRPLGRRHRARSRERDQGARARAARGRTGSGSSRSTVARAATRSRATPALVCVLGPGGREAIAAEAARVRDAPRPHRPGRRPIRVAGLSAGGEAAPAR